MKKIFLFVCLGLLFACSSEDNFDWDADNETVILAYLEANDLSEEAEKTPSGLYYVIQEEGSGDFPPSDATVTVAYRGFFSNGETFDESNSATFPLPDLIDGFSEGVQLLKPGGSALLLIPSRLGYGYDGNAFIAGGQVLIFEVELIDFQ